MPGLGGDHLGVWGGKQQTKHHSHQLVCPDSKGRVIPKTAGRDPSPEESINYKDTRAS